MYATNYNIAAPISSAAAAPPPKAEIAAAIMRPPARWGSRMTDSFADDHELLLVAVGAKLELVTGIRRVYENVYSAAMREVHVQTNLKYTHLPVLSPRVRKLVGPPPLGVEVFHLLVRHEDTEHMCDLLLPNNPRFIETIAAPPIAAVTQSWPTSAFRLVWCSVRNLRAAAAHPHRPPNFGPLLQWYMRNDTPHALLSVPGGFAEGFYTTAPVRAVNFRALHLLHPAAATAAATATASPFPRIGERRYTGPLAGPRVYSVDWAAVVAETAAAALSPNPTTAAIAAAPPAPTNDRPLGLAVVSACEEGGGGGGGGGGGSGSEEEEEDGEVLEDTPSHFPKTWHLLLRQTFGERTLALDLVGGTVHGAADAGVNATTLVNAVMDTMRDRFGVECNAEGKRLAVRTSSAVKPLHVLYHMMVRNADAVDCLGKKKTMKSAEKGGAAAPEFGDWGWWSMIHLIHLFNLQRKYRVLVLQPGQTRQSALEGMTTGGDRFLGRCVADYCFSPALVDYLQWIVCIQRGVPDWKPTYAELVRLDAVPTTTTTTTASPPPPLRLAFPAEAAAVFRPKFNNPWSPPSVVDSPLLATVRKVVGPPQKTAATSTADDAVVPPLSTWAELAAVDWFLDPAALQQAALDVW